MRIKFVILVAVILFSHMAFAAAKKGKSTNHRAAMEEQYLKRLNPGYEIPVNPDKHKWRTTGKIGDKVVYQKGVPLYSLDGPGGGSIGELPLGSEVKLEKVKAHNGRHYYGIERTETLKDGQVVKKMMWVDGFQLERN